MLSVQQILNRIFTDADRVAVGIDPTAVEALAAIRASITALTTPAEVIGHIKVTEAGCFGVEGIALAHGAEYITDLIGAETAVTVPVGTVALTIRTVGLGAGEGTLYYDGDAGVGVPFVLDGAAGVTQIPGWSNGLITTRAGLNDFVLVIDGESLIAELEVWALGPRAEAEQ